jgi:hypothetical protein
MKPPFTMPSTRRGFVGSFVAKYMFDLDKRAYNRNQRRPRPGEVDYLRGQEGYPINLDAGEHFFRLHTGIDFPWFPPMIGAMQEFLPQVDMLIWQNMYRKAPVGPLFDWQPGLAGLPTPVANTQYQLTVPGLTKVA